MLKLKCQYFGHLMWRADSLEKTLMLGKIEGRRRSGWQRMRWLDSITNSMDISLILGSRRSSGIGNGDPLQYSSLENSMERGAWWATVYGVAKCGTRLSTHTHIFLSWNTFSLFWQLDCYCLIQILILGFCLGWIYISSNYYYTYLCTHFISISKLWASKQQSLIHMIFLAVTGSECFLDVNYSCIY